jgi:hypothetical protein
MRLFLKGLSYEIDFENVDENCQILALTRPRLVFEFFRGPPPPYSDSPPGTMRLCLNVTKTKLQARVGTKSRVADPDWIRIQLGQWIRIQEGKNYPEK